MADKSLYRVNSGTHKDATGVYTKGAVVESGKDLVASFGLKFSLLGDGGKEAPKPKKVRKKRILGEAVISEDLPEMEEVLDEVEDDLPPIVAVHNKGGWYHVYRTDTAERLTNKHIQKAAALRMSNGVVAEAPPATI